MLSLHLLGARALRNGERDLSASIHYRKGWALLGYLAVERERLHSREHLAQLLWPQLPAASARTNLRQVVADLNRVLDTHGAAEVLVSTREDIALQARPPLSMDALSIDVLALDAPLLPPGAAPDAVALRRAERRSQSLGGEFLAGFSLPDCEEFEEWLLLARGRLASATAAALQGLCQAQESAGQGPQAMATAQRLAALDEWNEAHQRQLMRLLAAGGQAEQALARFDTLRASLRSELDSEPEPATVELAARIRDRQHSPDAVPAPPAGGLGLRRWVSAVYCRAIRPESGADREALARARGRLLHGGGRVLGDGEEAVLVCFGHDQAVPGAEASALQAAEAALAARGAAGARVAMSLCAGMVRLERHGGGLAVLGNPGQWALQLSERAGGGQVLLCSTLFPVLDSTYELRPLGSVPLQGVSAPLPLWELVGARAITAPTGKRLSQPSQQDGAGYPEQDSIAPETAQLKTLRMPSTLALPEAPPVAWLAVLQGAGQGRRVAVTEEPLLVGRAPDSDLQIPHRTVSRHHCAIWRDGGGYRIRDMGATNRTRVNDAAVQEVELGDGDLIVIGDSVLQFGRHGDPPTVQMDNGLR